mmetsp:Transcript_43818/g.70142  ORF Transcript_43818/g.70142 Transcript_43818/m.70142 type:complete len:98 (+) Transcript_43818:80-373(+)
MTITIYSKEQCKYCVMAKDFMGQNGIPYEEKKLDPESEGYAEERERLIEATAHKTFPWIYIKEDFVGGYNDLLHAYSTQKLHVMLQQAGVTIEEPDF